MPTAFWTAIHEGFAGVEARWAEATSDTAFLDASADRLAKTTNDPRGNRAEARPEGCVEGESGPERRDGNGMDESIRADAEAGEFEGVGEGSIVGIQ